MAFNKRSAAAPVYHHNPPPSAFVAAIEAGSMASQHRNNQQQPFDVLPSKMGDPIQIGSTTTATVDCPQQLRPTGLAKENSANAFTPAQAGMAAASLQPQISDHAGPRLNELHPQPVLQSKDQLQTQHEQPSKLQIKAVGSKDSVVYRHPPLSARILLPKAAASQPLQFVLPHNSVQPATQSGQSPAGTSLPQLNGSSVKAKSVHPDDASVVTSKRSADDVAASSRVKRRKTQPLTVLSRDEIKAINLEQRTAAATFTDADRRRAAAIESIRSSWKALEEQHLREFKRAQALISRRRQSLSDSVDGRHQNEAELENIRQELVTLAAKYQTLQEELEAIRREETSSTSGRSSADPSEHGSRVSANLVPPQMVTRRSADPSLRLSRADSRASNTTLGASQSHLASDAEDDDAMLGTQMDESSQQSQTSRPPRRQAALRSRMALRNGYEGFDPSSSQADPVTPTSPTDKSEVSLREDQQSQQDETDVASAPSRTSRRPNAGKRSKSNSPEQDSSSNEDPLTPIVTISGGRKLYKCRVCGRTFTHPPAVFQHIRAHAAPESSPTEPDKSQARDDNAVAAESEAAQDQDDAQKTSTRKRGSKSRGRR